MRPARPDTDPRGLLVPAWTRRSRPDAVVIAGFYTGLTVRDVAELVEVPVSAALEALLDGREPAAMQLRSRGRPLSPEGLARRRAAGIPEELVEESLEAIAAALGLSHAKLRNLVYRDAPIGRRLRP